MQINNSNLPQNGVQTNFTAVHALKIPPKYLVKASDCSVQVACPNGCWNEKLLDLVNEFSHFVRMITSPHDTQIAATTKRVYNADGDFYYVCQTGKDAANTKFNKNSETYAYSVTNRGMFVPDCNANNLFNEA